MGGWVDRMDDRGGRVGGWVDGCTYGGGLGGGLVRGRGADGGLGEDDVEGEHHRLVKNKEEGEGTGKGFLEVEVHVCCLGGWVGGRDIFGFVAVWVGGWVGGLGLFYSFFWGFWRA